MISFLLAVFAVALLLASAAAFAVVVAAAQMLSAPDFDERNSDHV
jgi:hypothetical protein